MRQQHMKGDGCSRIPWMDDWVGEVLIDGVREIKAALFIQLH